MKTKTHRTKQMIILFCIGFVGLGFPYAISAFLGAQPIQSCKATLGSQSEFSITQLPNHQTAFNDVRLKEAKRSNIFHLERIGSIPTELQDKPGRRQVSHIQFINDAQGWVSLNGELWYTLTHGQTWEMIHRDRANSIRYFEFINPQAGWLLVSGKLYKTQDGGRTWEVINQPINSNDIGNLLCFKLLKNGKEAWAGGSVFHPIPQNGPDSDGPPTRYMSLDGKKGLRGAIFHTTDAGNTWHQQLCGDWGYISNLFLINAEDGWASGMAGTYYYKGDEWHAIGSQGSPKYRRLPRCLEAEAGFPSAEPIQLYFINNKYGWLSNSNGRLGKSSDGGRTWADAFLVMRNKEDDLPIFFRELFFTDRNNGLALDNRGFLHESIDGGANWDQIQTNVRILSIELLDNNSGYALGNNGFYKFVLN
jgi:photosystem II stability/assembly factor-like uncharacterized protein